MKPWLKASWVGLLAVMIMTACQKGPEDPAFSFSTRKARLTGEWEVKSFTGKRPTLERSFDGSEMDYVENDTNNYSRTLTWTFEFNSDGSYRIAVSEEFEADSILGTAEYTEDRVEKGLWEFTGGNDKPSKSQLVLFTQEEKVVRSDQGSNVGLVTYENPRQATIYDIIGLSNDELKLEYDELKSFSGGSSRYLERYTMKKI